MAQASATEVFPCSTDEFFGVISDYVKYPEFLQEVKSCQILKEEGHRKLVEYKVSLVKSFTYKLWMTEEPGKLISWDFAGGDLFKTLTGKWELQSDGPNMCRATYTVDASFGLFVPGPIAKAAVSVNLPNMMASYQKRVKQLFGGR